MNIESYFKEAVIERNHLVEEFFDDKLIDFGLGWIPKPKPK